MTKTSEAPAWDCLHQFPVGERFCDRGIPAMRATAVENLTRGPVVKDGDELRTLTYSELVYQKPKLLTASFLNHMPSAVSNLL